MMTLASALKTAPTILKNDSANEYYFDEGCYILEYSNSEVDPDVSIARARVLPNTETQLHKLSQTVERYLILEGEGEVTLGDGGENNKKLSCSVVNKGDVVIIPENCPQAIRNIGLNDLIFLVICTPRFKPDNYIEY
ncbi:MAG: oxalate decarboxylase/phosphoglucose isomerase-like protein (cupin superfamily) [Cellvibrionaceae bacterium]|jgi:oxalate decarboxylase/phosphoglucose isomerase-like protein (cupin superfamily)